MTSQLIEQDRDDLDPEDDDEDDRNEGEQLSLPSAQDYVFDLWVTEKARTGELDRQREGTANDNHDDEQWTLKGIFAQQESTVIIDSPRDYQIELFERAKKANLIAVLDTGSGKTLIAVLLIRWMLDYEAETRPLGATPRVVFFLVPSVNLVLQQMAVLRSNLSQPIAELYGALNIDIWSTQEWQKTLLENRTIVCTADILRRALDKQFVGMQQICLLVFDEAHHTKRNHAYARIVKDHYIALSDPKLKPKIFGMTASPLDAKNDITSSASELEALLDSRIVTTGSMSTLSTVRRPTESNAYYISSVYHWNSRLAHSVATHMDTLLILQEQYDIAAEVARHLGPWCADHSMLHFLSEDCRDELRRLLTTRFKQAGRSDDVTELEATKATYEACFDQLTRQHGMTPAPAAVPDWSDKVDVLKRLLEEAFRLEHNNRCLVFVERKSTARLLKALFDAIKHDYIRCSYLVGANKTLDFEEQRQSFKQQAVTLSKFRKGDLNVLFATSVAEEGLDIPLCNLVIRFDLYRTMIQYIQSRGRARQEHSKFIHMIDRHNGKQQELQQQVYVQELRMRAWCQGLPGDRRLLSDEAALNKIMIPEREMRTFKHPTSDARLHYHNSMEHLAHFTSKWPLETNEAPQPVYVPISASNGFRYEVILPAGAPLQRVLGRPERQKIIARKSAAFDMCVMLFREGYLNDRFEATRQREAPAHRNAILAVENKAIKDYSMRTKPSIWTSHRGLQPSKLWMVKVDFRNGLDLVHTPLIMLTRSLMPVFPPFVLYRDDGKPTDVMLQSSAQSIEVDHEDLHLITAFTFRIFTDVFGKTYEEEAQQLSYYLAPAVEIDTDLTRATIDWKLLSDIAASTDDLKWSTDVDSSTLLGKVMVDSWHGGRKYLLNAVHPTLKPHDAVPLDAVKRAGDKHIHDILDYSIINPKKWRNDYEWCKDQPVLIVEQLRATRNMLKPISDRENNMAMKAYICPEPMRVSALPLSIFASCLAWPSVIWRIEATLIALEACHYVGISCEPSLALAAITKDTEHGGSANDTTSVLHSDMGENYERLEFLGDCFLKLATTLAVFTKRPDANEDHSHVDRMLMLCNKNLLNVSNELKLHEYIRSKPFHKRLWYPEGLHLLKGKGVGNSTDQDFNNKKHKLGDKTIADVSEALMGAAWLSHNEPGRWQPAQWEQAILAVTKLVDNELHNMKSWQDYVTSYQIPPYQIQRPTDHQQSTADRLSECHDYKFSSATLATSAFQHGSYPQAYSKIPSYERLEFLGDALLDMAVISYLFYRHPDRGPQWLTEAKSLMVGNDFYGFLACKLGFWSRIVYGSQTSYQQRDAYKAEYDDKINASSLPDAWLTLSPPPKSLADVVEAYVGAIFIDSGFDYGQVQNFFDQHIKPHFEDMDIYTGKIKGHPVTQLHHTLQVDLQCRGFKFISKPVPATTHKTRKDVVVGLVIHNQVAAFSTGASVRYAGDRAAKDANQKLQSLSRDDFKKRYGCTCVAKRDAETMSI